jgi:hypothetical protein
MELRPAFIPTLLVGFIRSYDIMLAHAAEICPLRGMCGAIVQAGGRWGDPRRGCSYRIMLCLV